MRLSKALLCDNETHGTDDDDNDDDESYGKWHNDLLDDMVYPLLWRGSGFWEDMNLLIFEARQENLLGTGNHNRYFSAKPSNHNCKTKKTFIRGLLVSSKTGYSDTDYCITKPKDSGGLF